MEIILEILIIFLLILFNGFLAMAEISVVSSRKTRLRLRAAEGKSGYQTALELKTNSTRFLSTVQIGITLVGILAGAFAGATLAEVLGAAITRVGISVGISEAIGVAIVVVFITYASLVFGELAPKQIGLLDPEGVASLVAGPMKFIYHISAPLVRFLSLSTSLVLKLLGVHPSTEPAVTEDEVKILIDQGAQLGVFDPLENKIIDNVFYLGDKRIASLATPRTETIWLDLDDPIQATIEKIKGVDYAHFPVAKGSLDNLIGFVKANDLLTQTLADGEIDLKRSLLEPLFVPENTLVLNALKRMRETGYEIAFIVDEFGGIRGLVTFHDLLEGFVGDLPKMDKMPDPKIARLEDGTYLLDGLLPIRSFQELLNVRELPGEATYHYKTLAGFVLFLFKTIPKPGESVDWEGNRIEIVDMDDIRIDKVRVIPGDTKEL